MSGMLRFETRPGQKVNETDANVVCLYSQDRGQVEGNAEEGDYRQTKTRRRETTGRRREEEEATKMAEEEGRETRWRREEEGVSKEKKKGIYKYEYPCSSKLVPNLLII